MAFILIGVGAILAWLDYQGTANLKGAGSLLYQELFSGSDPYYKWAGAIILIAAMGYITELQNVSTALLILITVVIVLAQSSGFNKLIKAL